MSIKETLEQNNNSIELSLVNFLFDRFGIKSDMAESKSLTELGSILVKSIPFNEYLELSYALDEYSPAKLNDEETENRIVKILVKHKHNIVAALRKETNFEKLQPVKDLVNKLMGRLKTMNETIKIMYLHGFLTEDEAKKFHYTANISKSVLEGVMKWLEERKVPHYMNEQEELVVECDTRDTLYAFDKFLSKTVEGTRTMFDSEERRKKTTEAKKRPQDMTAFDLARMKKPRLDPNTLPKSGAFAKDTKAMLKKADPHDRRAVKHKNKTYESEEKFILDEAILGMTQMPSIMRLQALAGVPAVESVEPLGEHVPTHGKSEKLIKILNTLEDLEGDIQSLEYNEFLDVKAYFQGIIDEFE
jgi:hypothetical protein